MNLDSELELKTDFPRKRIQLWSSLFPYEVASKPERMRRKEGWLMMAGFGVAFIFFAFALASTIRSFKRPKDKSSRQDQRASVWSYDSHYS